MPWNRSDISDAEVCYAASMRRSGLPFVDGTLCANRQNMRIDAVTTCVGPIYAAHLARTLPVWLESLDSMTIATNNSGLATWLYSQSHLVDAPLKRMDFIVTNCFSKQNACYNKGAALNAAVEQANPTDWLLSLDCDVLPPPNWRDYLAGLTPGKLYGCHRSDHHALKPSGYFQLWHSSDTKAGPFAECYAHAGRYDAEFTKRWPAESRCVLPLTLQHLGEPAKHWHGPGNESLTAAMLRDGVAAYRAMDERLR